MAISDTSKSDKQNKRRKAATPRICRTPSPTLMGITFPQHWTYCHLDPKPYPRTISDSVGRDASLAPTSECANAPKAMTRGTDSSFQDGSGLPCPSWPLASTCTEANNLSHSVFQVTPTLFSQEHGEDTYYSISQLTDQEYGVQPHIPQLQQWWKQEKVDEPYHGMGAISGNFTSISDKCPVSASIVGSEGAVWGSVCQDGQLGEVIVWSDATVHGIMY